MEKEELCKEEEMEVKDLDKVIENRVRDKKMLGSQCVQRRAR